MTTTNDGEWGLSLNTKTIGFLLSLTALIGVFWKTISYANQLDYRITTTESRIGQTDERLAGTNKNVEAINGKIDALKDTITELTISVRSLENEVRK